MTTSKGGGFLIKIKIETASPTPQLYYSRTLTALPKFQLLHLCLSLSECMSQRGLD